MRLDKCPCGSGLYPQANYDGHNIFLTYTCDRCHDQKMEGFRPDIHEHYDTDEPIDSD